MHRRQGGLGGRMVSGNNEQRSQCYGTEDQDLDQIQVFVGL